MRAGPAQLTLKSARASAKTNISNESDVSLAFTSQRKLRFLIIDTAHLL